MTKEIFSEEVLEECRDQWTDYILKRNNGLEKSELNALELNELRKKFDICVDQYVSVSLWSDASIPLKIILVHI